MLGIILKIVASSADSKAPAIYALDSDGFVWGNGENGDYEMGYGFTGNNNNNNSRKQRVGQSQFGWRNIPVPRTMQGRIHDINAQSFYDGTHSTGRLVMISPDGAYVSGPGDDEKAGIVGVSDMQVRGGPINHHYWGL